MVRKVVLQRKKGARWVNVVSGMTSRKGKETFRVAARQSSTSYRVVAKKLRARGNIYLADKSPRRTVETIAQAVTLTLASTTVELGEAVSAHVQSIPIRSGRTVTLQLREDGAWTQVEAARLSAAGTATFTVTAAGAGTHRYRAVAETYRGARSVASNEELLRAELPPEPDLTAPPAPSGLRSTVDDAGVVVSWDPVDAADLAGYKVYLRTAGADPWVLLDIIASTVTTFTATAHLTNGVENSIGVTAIDSSFNESDMSNVVTVVPTAPVVP
jgi:hypothetical protein